MYNDGDEGNELSYLSGAIATLLLVVVQEVITRLLERVLWRCFIFFFVFFNKFSSW